jgi:hypothetical protein
MKNFPTLKPTSSLLAKLQPQTKDFELKREYMIKTGNSR